MKKSKNVSLNNNNFLKNLWMVYIVFPNSRNFQFSIISKLVRGMFLLVFWKKGLLSWFSEVFAKTESTPLAGGQGQCKWLQIAPCGAVLLLEGFQHQLGVMKMAVPPYLAPELKAPDPHSSVGPHRKAVNHFCLPDFCPNSVFTQPVIKCFYLRHTAPFWVSKLYELLWCTPMLLPEEGVGILPCWDAAWRAYTRWCSCSWFTETPSRKLEPRLAVCSWLPLYNTLQTLPHFGTPILFVTLGSWGHPIPPGILPYFATWAPFRQECPPLEQTSESSNFALCCL